ncbi:TetR/AcrR family transcriptional regulator [Thioclava sp. GXIMD4215]|uniref:TetR/AcrR family transcriptional regulator n=1 Tax=Thioclava sp. GXIMD4215 TaxID=3131928 RepID=UPI00324AF40F
MTHSPKQPAMETCIRRGRKFDQVLEGARKVFLRDGFEGASVDDIAREAGGSKATLYSYVPDKRLLFMVFAQQECAMQAQSSMSPMEAMDAPIEVVLTGAAEKLTTYIFSDFGRDIFRICVAEAERFPEVGRQFYATGHVVVCDKLVGLMRRGAERGELKIEDFDFAAEQFLELCKANLHAKIVFGLPEMLTEDCRQRTVKEAVAMFMARYGTKCHCQTEGGAS